MTNLAFTKKSDDRYESTALTSSGSTAVIQMNRADRGNIVVEAALEGFDFEEVKGLSHYDVKGNYLFAVDFPANVKFRIVSSTNVTKCGYEME